MCVYYPDFQDNQTTRAVASDPTTRQGVLVDTEVSLDAFFSREVVIIELVLQTIFFCILVSLRVWMAGGHSADATAQSRRECLLWTLRPIRLSQLPLVVAAALMFRFKSAITIAPRWVYMRLMEKFPI